MENLRTRTSVCGDISGKLPRGQGGKSYLTLAASIIKVQRAYRSIRPSWGYTIRREGSDKIRGGVGGRIGVGGGRPRSSQGVLSR